MFGRGITVAVSMFAVLLFAGGGLAASSKSDVRVATPSQRVSPTVTIDTRARRILREMGGYLAGVRAFSLRADVAYDEVLTDGQKIQYGGNVKISVVRSNRLRVEFVGDERHTRVFFNGRTITILDVGLNVYSVTEVPPDIDTAVDMVFDKYGISVPIADFVFSNPYQVLIKNVQTGYVVGRHLVAGIPTFHLAFTQEEIDWQIWVEDGPHPVPRKLLITYKNEPGSPQYMIRFTGWNFTERFAEHYFNFYASPNADQIEFLPVAKVGGAQ